MVAASKHHRVKKRQNKSLLEGQKKSLNKTERRKSIKIKEQYEKSSSKHRQRNTSETQEKKKTRKIDKTHEAVENASTSNQDEKPGCSQRKTEKKKKKQRKTPVKRSIEARDGGCVEETSPPRKKKRLSGSNSVKTRSRGKLEIGKTKFTFDSVSCECPENEHYTLYLDGIKNLGCSCGKRQYEFMKLIGGLEEKKAIVVTHEDQFAKLSIEILCYIFKYLTIKQLMRLESLSTKIQKAVLARLKLTTEIDFMEDVGDHRLYENGLTRLTNYSLMSLISKLPSIRNIYNFHPAYLSSSYPTNRNAKNDLSVLGVVSAFMSSKTLEGIEISSLDLLEVISADLPHLMILNRFSNRERAFPSQTLQTGPPRVLKEEMKVTNLHLVGCNLFHLPSMDGHLEHIYLRWVKC